MKKLGYLLALIPLCVLFILGGCAGNGGKSASVTIDKSTLSLVVGDESVLTVTTKECADFTVESSEDAFVKVERGENNTVIVKAIAAGEATVTVKGVDEKGAKLAEQTCVVTVTEGNGPDNNNPSGNNNPPEDNNPPEGTNPIKINLPSGKLVLRKNRSATVKAFVSVAYTDDPIWESDNDEIATVEFQGLTAIISTHDTSGECTVTLTIGDMTQTFTVVCGVK